MTAAEVDTQMPVNIVVERINEPATAAALVTLLDNAELLSTLVLALGGFVARGEIIMDAVADSVQEFKSGADTSALPSATEVGAMANQLSEAAPVLNRVMSSSMVAPETIDLLSMLSDAAGEGIANAKANETKVGGIRDSLRLLKDPEVQRGMGAMVEIARAIGRRVEAQP